MTIYHYEDIIEDISERNEIKKERERERERKVKWTTNSLVIFMDNYG